MHGIYHNHLTGNTYSGLINRNYKNTSCHVLLSLRLRQGHILPGIKFLSHSPSGQLYRSVFMSAILLNLTLVHRSGEWTEQGLVFSWNNKANCQTILDINANQFT